MRFASACVDGSFSERSIGEKLPVVVSGALAIGKCFASVVDMPNGHAKAINKAIVDLMMIISV